MADIQTHVVDKGLSLASDEERGEVFYQRGLVISMMLAEGVRTAQEMHGTAQITPAQLRDGLANLNITAERLEELGMTGMVPPFSTNCANHTGHSGAWMLEWDGTQFVQASDLLTADRSVIDPLQAEKAAEYAGANAPWPMDESCNPS
jgi:branched-chain amino acid transport system substrate-binding protein